jgi:adenylylsulfate kinase-like enzyme
VTGLSGAGKTTVASAVKDRLMAASAVNPVLLDGDRLRAVLPATAGYEPEDRRKLAMFYARLARELAAQGHCVICSTVSLFHEVHAWSRRNTPRYLEVWLRVPLQELRDRGCRDKLYSPNGDANGVGPVVGVDSGAEFPVQPDLIIGNYGDMSVEEAAERIVTALWQLVA